MAEPPTRTRLRANVLGLGSSVTIDVASAAPAYSLAAMLGVLAGAVALHAPATLLLAFIPMVCTAAAYNAFDRVAPGWQRVPMALAHGRATQRLDRRLGHGSASMRSSTPCTPVTRSPTEGDPPTGTAGQTRALLTADPR